jgi:methionyl aminopeptidase
MFMAKPKPTRYGTEAIEAIRAAAVLLSEALAAVKPHVRPGVNTLELDQIVDEYITSRGGHPAFKGYTPSFSEAGAYPFATCISVNEAVVHGLPKADIILQEGDVVSVDAGVQLNGYFADSAYTFGVGTLKPEVQRLLDVTRHSLERGVAAAIHGNRVGDIGYAVQSYIQPHGYGIVRDMVGHGLGKTIHEPPEVPNYGKRGNGIRLEEGMVLAIEPMINMGKANIQKTNDGWTVITRDRKPSAHYEHTVVVRKGKPEVLTTFSLIEN